MTIVVSQPLAGLDKGAARLVSRGMRAADKAGAAAAALRRTSVNDDIDDMTRLLSAVARQRDMAAFETLFRHYAPKVKAYLLRHVREAQLAEELMQETMMAVWTKAALFDPARGSVSAWIFTIARNLCISAFRKRNRPEFDPHDPAFVPDEVPAADTQLQQRQDGQRLRDAMGLLPAEQKDLLARAFFGEVSHGTLARELGLPLGTVKSRLRMAVAKLRRALEERS